MAASATDPASPDGVELLQQPECAECGYALTSLGPTGRCPECGAPYGAGVITFNGWGRGHHFNLVNCRPRYAVMAAGGLCAGLIVLVAIGRDVITAGNAFMCFLWVSWIADAIVSLLARMTARRSRLAR